MHVVEQLGIGFRTIKCFDRLVLPAGVVIQISYVAKGSNAFLVMLDFTRRDERRRQSLSRFVLFVISQMRSRDLLQRISPCRRKVDLGKHLFGRCVFALDRMVDRDPGINKVRMLHRRCNFSRLFRLAFRCLGESEAFETLGTQAVVLD